MRSSLFAGLMFLIMPETGAVAQPYLSFGTGNRTCSEWLHDPVRERLGADYIAGFWTGLNFASEVDRQVGHSMDAAGKIGAVRQVCSFHPDMALVDAALAAYTATKERERRGL